VLAWPLAYFGMNQWLEAFAYRVGIGIGPFLLAALAALAIALLAISYHALRAAHANPVDALRYE
jgi:putative ABC transport system permease protein